MIARADGDRVWIGSHLDDPDRYVKPLARYAEAFDDYHANKNDLPEVALRPVRERLLEAEQEWEDALSETYSIEVAERICHQLAAQILKAKVARGDYEYHDTDSD